MTVTFSKATEKAKKYTASHIHVCEDMPINEVLIKKRAGTLRSGKWFSFSFTNEIQLYELDECPYCNESLP